MLLGRSDRSDGGSPRESHEGLICAAGNLARWYGSLGLDTESSMKVLLSYANHFDKGEGVHFSRVLERLGHEVVELNVGSSAPDLAAPGRNVSGFASEVSIQELCDFFASPDLYLYIEPLGLIPRGLESSPIATACVICDTHRNLADRRVLARLFDHVFLYQRNYVSAFDEHPKSAVHWLPYACDVKTVRDLGLPRDLDVGFIGQLFAPGSERRRILDQLAKKYRINEQRSYLQAEIPEVYSRAKIVLNLPIGDDLNFRFFEALSCGAMLLTRRISNGQDLLFREGEHYVAFDDERELMGKVEYYLSHEEERRRIAEAGAAENLSKHTLDLRLVDMLKIAMSEPAKKAPIRGMSERQAVRTYSRVLERMGRVDSILRLAARHPNARWTARWHAIRAFGRRMILNW